MEDNNSSSVKFPNLLSSFWLKIIGLITMVVDHIGATAMMLNKVGNSPRALFNYNIYYALRAIGRIAFPIYAFLIIEGILHSRKSWLYVIRLFIFSFIIDIGYGLFTLITNNTFIYECSPITALALGASCIYFLNQQNKWLKPISLIPLIISILSALNYLPVNIEYDLYGITLIILFYISYLLAKVFINVLSKNTGLDKDLLIDNYEFLAKKLISALLFIIFALLIVFFNTSLLWNGTNLFINDAQFELYALLSLIPLTLYSGKRGYNATWFKYGNYLFFPLHIALIYLIISLI